MIISKVYLSLLMLIDKDFKDPIKEKYKGKNKKQILTEWLNTILKKRSVFTFESGNQLNIPLAVPAIMKLKYFLFVLEENKEKSDLRFKQSEKFLSDLGIICEGKKEKPEYNKPKIKLGFKDKSEEAFEFLPDIASQLIATFLISKSEKIKMSDLNILAKHIFKSVNINLNLEEIKKRIVYFWVETGQFKDVIDLLEWCDLELSSYIFYRIIKNQKLYDVVKKDFFVIDPKLWFNIYFSSEKEKWSNELYTDVKKLNLSSTELFIFVYTPTDGNNISLTYDYFYKVIKDKKVSDKIKSELLLILIAKLMASKSKSFEEVLIHPTEEEMIKKIAHYDLSLEVDSIVFSIIQNYSCRELLSKKFLESVLKSVLNGDEFEIDNTNYRGAIELLSSRIFGLNVIYIPTNEVLKFVRSLSLNDVQKTKLLLVFDFENYNKSFKDISEWNSWGEFTKSRSIFNGEANFNDNDLRGIIYILMGLYKKALKDINLKDRDDWYKLERLYRTYVFMCLRKITDLSLKANLFVEAIYKNALIKQFIDMAEISPIYVFVDSVRCEETKDNSILLDKAQIEKFLDIVEEEIYFRHYGLSRRSLKPTDKQKTKYRMYLVNAILENDKLGYSSKTKLILRSIRKDVSSTMDIFCFLFRSKWYEFAGSLLRMPSCDAYRDDYSDLNKDEVEFIEKQLSQCILKDIDRTLNDTEKNICLEDKLDFISMAYLYSKKVRDGISNASLVKIFEYVLNNRDNNFKYGFFSCNNNYYKSHKETKNDDYVLNSKNLSVYFKGVWSKFNIKSEINFEKFFFDVLNSVIFNDRIRDIYSLGYDMYGRIWSYRDGDVYTVQKLIKFMNIMYNLASNWYSNTNEVILYNFVFVLLKEGLLNRSGMLDFYKLLLSYDFKDADIIGIVNLLFEKGIINHKSIFNYIESTKENRLDLFMHFIGLFKWFKTGQNEIKTYCKKLFCLITKISLLYEDNGLNYEYKFGQKLVVLLLDLFNTNKNIDSLARSNSKEVLASLFALSIQVPDQYKNSNFDNCSKSYFSCFIDHKNATILLDYFAGCIESPWEIARLYFNLNIKSYSVIERENMERKVIERSCNKILILLEYAVSEGLLSLKEVLEYISKINSMLDKMDACKRKIAESILKPGFDKFLKEPKDENKDSKHVKEKSGGNPIGTIFSKQSFETTQKTEKPKLINQNAESEKDF